MLLFVQSILEANSNDNLHHVPAEATFAMRLDGREIAEKTVFSVFLESKDNEVLDLIQKSVSKNLKGDGKFKNYGIDYLSDVVLFQIPFQKTNIEGLLVNVSNEKLFNKNMTGTSNVYACSGNVGVILTNPSSKKLDRSALEDLAMKIVTTEHDHKMAKFFANHGSGKFIETYNKGSFFGRSALFGQTNILFELQGRSLLLTGNLEINKDKGSRLNGLEQVIQGKGLHFSSSVVPSAMSDSLSGWLDQFGIDLPQMKSISMNYMGVKVINHTSGFFAVPQIELLVETETPVSISEILSNENLKSYVDYDLAKNRINIQDEILYYKQLSPTSFYIGVSSEPSIVQAKGKEIMVLDGSIKPLTNVQGGGLMTAFLEMIPIFQASKTLAEHTDKLSVKLTKVNDSKAYLKGDLKFNEGCYPMNELMRFVLVSELTE